MTTMFYAPETRMTTTITNHCMTLFCTRCDVHFCGAMLWKRGLCRHAMSVCLSVTFVNSVKTSILKKIIVFPYKTLWQYSDGDSPNGGVECRWGRHKSRFWTNSWLSINDCWTFEQLRRTTVQFIAQTATHQWIFVYHSLQYGRIRRREEKITEVNCTLR